MTDDTPARCVYVYETSVFNGMGLPRRNTREIEQAAYEAWQRWLDEPVPMKLVVRAMPAMYTEQPLHEKIQTPAEAETFGRDLARKIRKRMCLVVSRRKSIWIGYDGEIEKVTETRFGEPNEPSMAIGGHRVAAHIDYTRLVQPAIDEPC